MNNDNPEKSLDFYALIFGNNEYRELGKEKSKWFKKIFDALEKDEPGFLEFIIMAEFRYGSIVSKEELLPTNSLLLKKMIKKSKEKREKAIIDFYHDSQFDTFCKNTFDLIKESISNGNT